MTLVTEPEMSCRLATSNAGTPALTPYLPFALDRAATPTSHPILLGSLQFHCASAPSASYHRGMDETPGQHATQILRTVWESTAEACTSLSPTEWDLSTDCPGWSVRDVLSHVIGIERTLMGDPTPPHEGDFGAHVVTPFGEVNEAWVEARRRLPGEAVLAEFKDVTNQRLEQLAAMSDEEFAVVGWSPVGQVPYAEFMTVRVLDCWVHEQDIRGALGSPRWARRRRRRRSP